MYGNIDGSAIRSVYPENLQFVVEEVPVFIQHIAGLPGALRTGVKDKLKACGAEIIYKRTFTYSQSNVR